jgi:peroxiredoxin
MNQEAPDFELSGTAPMAIRLSGLRGKNVVLAFYEVAFNEEDTAEMEAFRELTPDFEAANAKVLAISQDPVGIASGFAASNNLDFPLLCDDYDHAVCVLYDAWRTDMGYASVDGGMARRMVYIIDKDGMIRGVVSSDVPAAQQPEEALKQVQALA